jgi:hypothetical protein
MLASITDPAMRKDVEYVVRRGGYGWASFSPQLINGKVGHQYLGYSLCHYGIQDIKDGKKDGIAIFKRGMMWLKLAKQEYFGNERLPGGDPQEVIDAYSKALDNALPTLVEKEQKEEFQRRLPALLAARKDVGDKVCDGEGHFGYVEKVYGDKIQVRTRSQSVTMLGNVVNEWENLDWIKYNSVYKCDDE